MKYEMNL